jgi:hypothetical protein
MNAKTILRRIFLGIASGVLAGICCLIVSYFVGVIGIAISLREALATLLAAVTVLPLMLIIVGVPVTFVLGLMTGGLLGTMAALRNRPFGFLVSALVGMVCAELVLTLFVPLIAPPQPGDFIHIISNPYLSGTYGVLLGAFTSGLFAWMEPREIMNTE